MFDRIEAIRGAAVTAIKGSTLPDQLAIELRQSINQAIDKVVSQAISTPSTGTTPNPPANPNLVF